MGDKTSPIKGFISGGFGGAGVVLSGHPFDTMKVRLQTMPVPLPGQAPQYTSTMDCARKIFRQEGLRGFYKGMATPLVGVVPVAAIGFFGFNVGKAMQQDKPDDPLTYRQHFVAGMTAAVFATPIVAPGERIKCLLQVQQTAVQKKYNGPIDCGKQLLKEGGIRNLFRGTNATLLRDMPRDGVFFASYEWLQHALTPEGSRRSDLSPVRIVVSGGLAGMFCWLLALPADSLKSRLQIAPLEKYPKGVRSVFVELMREEGVRALYKGFTPVMLRAFPANGIMFLGYEACMTFLSWAENKMSNS